MTAIGIRLAIRKDKLPELRKMARNGKIPFASDGWLADWPDASNFLQLLYGPNAGQENQSRFKLPEYDRLFREQQALPDGPKRIALVNRMQELMVAYAPIRLTQHALEDHAWHAARPPLQAAPVPVVGVPVLRRGRSRRRSADPLAVRRGRDGASARAHAAPRRRRRRRPASIACPERVDRAARERIRRRPRARRPRRAIDRSFARIFAAARGARSPASARGARSARIQLAPELARITSASRARPARARRRARAPRPPPRGSRRRAGC